jgi:hypothetical protein
MIKRMTKWETGPGWGLIVGIGMMLAIVSVDTGLIWLAATRPLNIGTFFIGLVVLLSLPFLGLIVYWLYGLILSMYSLDRNALIIHWGTTEQIIPTAQIEQVLKGEEVEGQIRFRGGRWPGHCVGYGELADIGPTLFYATAPPQRQVYVVTPGLTYGISPADREEFLESLYKRLQMGPTQVVEQSSRRPNVLEWAFWRDRLALSLLGVGFLALLVLIGLLCLRFPSLPMLMPLHFDIAGAPDRFGPRGQMFIIPLIGLLAFLANGVLGVVAYRRERVASYMLWGGAVLIQLLTWAAALGLLGRV